MSGNSWGEAILSVQSGYELLAGAGLVMQAALAVNQLPRWATDPMAATGIDLAPFSTLVLLGQGGTRLWEYIAECADESADPFDEASIRLAQQFAVDHAGADRWQIVYPGEALLPLGRLAELAGWGKPSPLGLTINDEYGLWLAHRVAILVDASVPAATSRETTHPCDSCVAKPCVTACPVGAVHPASGFDVETCSTFRVVDASVCAYQCLARSACPIGTQHQYGPEQMKHHYGSGLESIRRYFDAS